MKMWVLLLQRNNFSKTAAIMLSNVLCYFFQPTALPNADLTFTGLSFVTNPKHLFECSKFKSISYLYLAISQAQ